MLRHQIPNIAQCECVVQALVVYFGVYSHVLPQFYALYKQATEGPCRTSQPGFWDLVGKAKW